MTSSVAFQETPKDCLCLSVPLCAGETSCRGRSGLPVACPRSPHVAKQQLAPPVGSDVRQRGETFPCASWSLPASPRGCWEACVPRACVCTSCWPPPEHRQVGSAGMAADGTRPYPHPPARAAGMCGRERGTFSVGCSFHKALEFPTDQPFTSMVPGSS